MVVADPTNVGETWNTATILESYCSEVGSKSDLYFDADDTEIQPIIQLVVDEQRNYICSAIDSAATTFPSEIESATLAKVQSVDVDEFDAYVILHLAIRTLFMWLFTNVNC